MPAPIGALLALAVALLGRVAGLDRDRAAAAASPTP